MKKIILITLGFTLGALAVRAGTLAPINAIVKRVSGTGAIGSEGYYSFWVGGVGGTAPSQVYTSVSSFELPALPPGQEVFSAKFSCEYGQLANGSINADLYGVRWSVNPDAVAGDFYQGPYQGSGAVGTGIMEKFLTPATPLGTVNLAVASEIPLGEWVQAQYDAGATAGNYLFISMNADGPVDYGYRGSTGGGFVTLTLTTMGFGPSDLSFTNKMPAQLSQKPQTTTDLSVVIRNDGYDATDVTSALSPNYGWLSVNTGTRSNAAIAGFLSRGTVGEATNLYNVTISSAAPAGTYPNAFTLSGQGTGSDSSANSFSDSVPLEILSTVFSSMDKTALASGLGGTDITTLTISNTAAWALSYTVTDTASWLTHSAPGTLAPGGVATITVTADSAIDPLSQGQYNATLTVTYLNNGSQPNPVNFPIVYDVGPKISIQNHTITEVGGVNNYPGVYEPGEVIEIEVFSINDGAITVSNILNTLSAPGFFGITPPSDTYSVMAVTDTTSTFYTVTIAGSTLHGTYTFDAVNSAGGTEWPVSFTLDIYSQAIPSVSPNPLNISVVEGQTGSGTLTVSNAGNAELTFSITDNAVWPYTWSVDTNAAPSAEDYSGTPLPLHDPRPENPYIVPGSDGQSDSAPIGFAFPFYGTDYTHFYVNANGAIILREMEVVGNTARASMEHGDLPVGLSPMIAPFRDVNLVIDDATPIRYELVSNPERLRISYDNVTLRRSVTTTGLSFQAELFADGTVKFSYHTMSGPDLGMAAVGLQSLSGTEFVQTDAVPSSGDAYLFTSALAPWASFTPMSGIVPPFGSLDMTIPVDGTDQELATSNSFTATFNWGGGASGSEGVIVNLMVGLASPQYSAQTNLAFQGPTGEVTSTPFVITNIGNAPIAFSITKKTNGLAYFTTNTPYEWIDISRIGTEIQLNDPDPNPYITASDQGFSDPIPLGKLYTIPFGSFSKVIVYADGYLKTGNFVASIRPYNGDLAMDENALLRYHVNSNRLVVTWENMKQYGLNGGDDLTFQVVVAPDSDFVFNYMHLEGGRWPYSVSHDIIQPADWWTTTNSLSGHVYTNYVDVITDRAILSRPTEVQVIGYTPQSGTVPAGETFEVTITGDASRQPEGVDFAEATATLDIVHSIEMYEVYTTNGWPGYEVITNFVKIGTNTLDVAFYCTNSAGPGFVRGGEIENDPDADSDGDGLTDREERIVGSDTQDPDSTFAPRVTRTDSGALLSWDAPIDGLPRTYNIYWTTDLTAGWELLDTVTEETSYPHETDEPVVYYKVTVQ